LSSVDVVSVCSGGGAVVVAEVSVCSGGGAGCFVFFGGGGNSVCGFVFVITIRDGCCGCVVVITRGGGGAVGRTAGGTVVVTGSVPASEPGGTVPVVSTFGVRVKLLVVSALVFVIGGGVSPGALIVDDTPLAWPSETTA